MTRFLNRIFMSIRTVIQIKKLSTRNTVLILKDKAKVN